MGTIQQTFEIDQPASAVYEALSEPRALLEKLPRVTGATRIAEDHYRVILGPIETPRDVDVHLARQPALRRLEWRTADESWSGAVTVEPIGPARSAVAVHAESTAPENLSPPSSVVHDTLQAFQRALQSRDVRISRGENDARPAQGGAGARRYAADWRDAARNALARPAELPFALIRNFSRQADRVWEQVWRGTPMARLPHMMPGLTGLPWNPDLEVCEHDDYVRVCVDVPGIDESQLQVEIDDGLLTVRGERHDERATEPGHRRSELHYGAFTRRIPLPDGVDADAARALLRNGVLEVRIPRRRHEPRRVPVQHAS